MKREAERREQMSVVIYIPVLIIPQMWMYPVLLHASLNQSFIIVIKRFTLQNGADGLEQNQTAVKVLPESKKE